MLAQMRQPAQITAALIQAICITAYLRSLNKRSRRWLSLNSLRAAYQSGRYVTATMSTLATHAKTWILLDEISLFFMLTRIVLFF